LKQVLILFIAFLSFSSVFAQVESEATLTEKKKKNKLKFIFNFDARRSFMIGRDVKFSGIKIGLGNKKHRFGIGFYNNRKPVMRIDDRLDRLNATDTTLFDYSYSSLFYERILVRTKRWELSAPVHLNFGKLNASFIDTVGVRVPFYEQETTSMTFSFKGHFKIWRWIGVAAGMGYNQMLGGENQVRRALSAPFYSYGVKVFLGELWKLTFKKDYRKSEWID
jgi:hypothetical protein